ncbi:MAG: (2Fe-2S)-binding protein [Desulfobacterales bacterium]|nr:(2Fe-2S)-binding protein [Desulfobacterales bacterium]
MNTSPTICFCFGYSEKDIVEDVKANGESRIMEKIMAAKRFGQCECATQNPKGT